MVFTKLIPDPLEIELQQIAARHGFAPKIISWVSHDNEIKVDMQTIEGHTLDEAADQLTDTVWQQIERILAILYEQEGIEYVDITSYNFMQDAAGKVWIIDFGHAYYTPKEKGEEPANWFLASLLRGDTGKAWNTDFA